MVGKGRRVRARQAGLAAALLCLGLAGCAQAQSSPQAPNATAPAAPSPQAAPQKSTLKSLTDAAGFSTNVKPAKDFVQKSRPSDIDYLPVGVTPPGRTTKVMTPKELETATQQLDSTRAAHDRLAGRKPPPAAPAKPPKKPSTKKQGENPPASQ